MKTITPQTVLLSAIGSLALSIGSAVHAESNPMLGEITLYAFNFAPRGWANANGQLLPINQNQGLFSLLGVAYGGNGQTTFALPDLRGRTPIGSGVGSDGIGGTVMGQQSGASTATLTQISGLVATSLTTEARGVVTSARNGGIVGVPQFTKTAISNGSGTPVNTRSPALGMNYSIALQGLYGGRDCFIGEIIAYAGTYLSGSSFLPADGRLLPISTNTALFSILGTTYGGNGQSTFALPNLNSRAPVGAGTGPGLPTVVLGESAGQMTTTLTLNHMPATPLGYNITTKSIGVDTSARISTNQVNVVTQATPIATGSTSLPVQPPSLGINYYICVSGTFPPRS